MDYYSVHGKFSFELFQIHSAAILAVKAVQSVLLQHPLQLVCQGAFIYIYYSYSKFNVCQTTTPMSQEAGKILHGKLLYKINRTL